MSPKRQLVDWQKSMSPNYDVFEWSGSKNWTDPTKTKKVTFMSVIFAVTYVVNIVDLLLFMKNSNTASS